MEIELTEADKNDLRTALNLLIEKEKDSVCYKELFDKLGLDDEERLRIEKKVNEKLVLEYVDKESQITAELQDLKNWGGECGCGNREIIRIIHEGEFPEIFTYCLNCGGMCEQ